MNMLMLRAGKDSMTNTNSCVIHAASKQKSCGRLQFNVMINPFSAVFLKP